MKGTPAPSLTPAEVDTILNYYRITHPSAQAPDIDALKSTLERFEPPANALEVDPHIATRLATALSGGAAAGLAAALIAPMMPLVMLAGALAGGWLGWRMGKPPAAGPAHPNN